MADNKTYEPLNITSVYDLEKCPIINKTDYLLFKLVHSLNVQGKSCYAHNKYLIEQCGANEKAIQRSIVKLIKLRLLKRGRNAFGSRRLKTTYLYLKDGTIVENNIDNDLIFDTLTNFTYAAISDKIKDKNTESTIADKIDLNTNKTQENGDILANKNDENDSENSKIFWSKMSTNMDQMSAILNNNIYNIVDNKLSTEIDDKSSIIKLNDKSFSTTKGVNKDSNEENFEKENNKMIEQSSALVTNNLENEKNNNVCAYESITSSCDEPQSQPAPSVQCYDNDVMRNVVSTEYEQLNFFDDIYNNSVENFKTDEQLNDNNINETIENDELKPGEGLALNENLIDLTVTETVEENNMEIKKTDIFGNSHNTNIENQNQSKIKPGLDVETKNADPCVMSIKIDRNKTGLLKSHIKQNRTTKEQKKNKFVEFCEYAKNIGTSEKLTFSIQRYVKWLLGNRKVDINQWKLTIDNLNSELNSITMSSIREQAAIEAFDTSYASGYIKLFVDKYKYKPYMNSPQTYNKYKFSLQNNTAFANNYNSQNNNNDNSSINNYEPDFATDENGNLLTF